MPAVFSCSGAERLLVEDRPLRLGIVQNRTAARKAGALIDGPGRRMAIAGFENEALQPLLPGQRFDALHDQRPDLQATMRRACVHAFDFADASGMAFQCTASDGLTALPSSRAMNSVTDGSAISSAVIWKQNSGGVSSSNAALSSPIRARTSSCNGV